MRYWEIRNPCNNSFKQRYVNPLLWMQFNEDGNNGMTNNMQEIWMTIFPIWSTTKEQIVLSTPTYLSKHTGYT